MKIRRLPEIDLAKFVALNQGYQLEQALHAYNSGGGAWSYDPVRSSTSDIVGAVTPLYGKLSGVSWEQIKRQIEKSCKRGADQTKANVEVGKVLYDAVSTYEWSAAKFHMGRLPIGVGNAVRYWSDVILEDGQGIFVPFFDHRREHGIASREARRVLFSMQHIWIRDRHPDLAGARLALVKFPASESGRGLRVEFHDDGELIPFSELDARVRFVYETWERVSLEKAHVGKRTGTGGPTLF